MKTEFPAYIVAEIPEPVRSKIQTIRDYLHTPTATLPVEVTLAGSSGVGPIAPGIDVPMIIEGLTGALTGVQPFGASFSGIRAFPGGSTVFLSPADSRPFDSLHRRLRESRIPFSESSFPYTPHCTIRSGATLSAEELSTILKLRYPEERFQVATISIYSLNASTTEFTLLYQQKLEAEPDAALSRMC